jgi:ACS family glucarate transporter-like MFS transporter
VSDRPTHVRWLILGVTTLCSLLLYLDRFCVSFAAESIRVEFQATKSQMGWFHSAFFWSYALAQVPAGWLGQRFGIRWTLTSYVLLWSLFTALMGFAGGIVAVIAFRLGCGLAQAGAYPCAARAVRDWMPIVQRGTASSVVALGGRIGGMLAPVLTGLAMLWFAQRDGSPNVRPDEVRDVALLAKTFVPDGEAEWSSSLWSRLEPIEQSAFQEAASGTAPVGAVAEIVNRLPLAEWLATQSPDAESSKLPADIRQRFFGRASGDPELTRRQFLESVSPNGIRKLESRGWRRTMIVFGVAGLIVAVAFWGIFRETPAQHPSCNVAEQHLIGQSPTPATNVPAEPVPLRQMLTSVSLWGNCLAQFTTNVGWVFLVTWLPQYLENVHRLPVVQRGVLSSVPIFAGMIGMLLGGPWTDLMTRRFGMKAGRRWPVVISRLIAALGYGGCLLSATGIAGPMGTAAAVGLAIAGLALVAIGTDLGVAATWAFAQDVGGRHTASILGWGNMWGNLGAAIAPLVASRILSESPTLGEWNLLFGLGTAAFVLSAAGASVMDASRPLVPLDEIASTVKP